MFPLVERIYQSHLAKKDQSAHSHKICRLLEGAQHIEVEFSIFDFARKLAHDHCKRKSSEFGEIPFPDGARLFANSIALTIDFPARTANIESDRQVCQIFLREGEFVNLASLTEAERKFPSGRNFLHIAGWIPGKYSIAYGGEAVKHIGEVQTFITAMECAFLLSLINQHRFITNNLGASRQQRKAFERRFGFAAMGWHRVTWNIGEDVKAKVARSDPDNAMPLHFCRAHWRKAAEGQPKAIKRNDEPGWWCWVSECWKGHPAFGVKLHHYTPQLRA